MTRTRPKRVLVLGVTGMLGHDTYRYFRIRGSRVTGTYRQLPAGFFRLLGLSRAPLFLLDASGAAEQLPRIVQQFRPDAVVNCIASLRPDVACFREAFLANCHLPRVVSDLAYRLGFIHVHVSTDGVFNGRAGPYDTSNMPDSDDDYGATKANGEFAVHTGIIIRTSIIGRSITGRNQGLIDWLISTSDPTVKGFTGYQWNGVTTLALAEAIGKVVEWPPTERRVVLHVGSKHTTKYDALVAIKKVYRLRKTIVPVSSPQLDRRLIADSEYSPRSSLEEQLVAYREFCGESIVG